MAGLAGLEGIIAAQLLGGPTGVPCSLSKTLGRRYDNLSQANEPSRILAVEGPGEMLLVKTRIGFSSIHGIGLFADEDIASGTVVWDFMPPFDLMVSAEKVASLPEAARTQVLKYSYYDEDEEKYVLCGDDARHFNHSETPNTGNGCEEDGTENATIALRDIRVGEELTCNYFDFDGEAQERVGAFETSKVR